MSNLYRSKIGRAFENEALAHYIASRVPGAFVRAWTDLDCRELRTGRPVTFYSPVLSTYPKAKAA